MATKWRKNGDKNGVKMATKNGTKWRQNGDKMTIKCDKMAKKWQKKWR